MFFQSTDPLGSLRAPYRGLHEAISLGTSGAAIPGFNRSDLAHCRADTMTKEIRAPDRTKRETKMSTPSAAEMRQILASRKIERVVVLGAYRRPKLLGPTRRST